MKKRNRTNQSGIFNRRFLLSATLCILAFSFGFSGFAFGKSRKTVAAAQASGKYGNTSAATQALAQLQSKAQVFTQMSPRTGYYDFVKAAGTDVLSADRVSDAPEKRARSFLAQYGALVGMNDAERTAVAGARVAVAVSNLKTQRTETDSMKLTHVTLTRLTRGCACSGPAWWCT